MPSRINQLINKEILPYDKSLGITKTYCHHNIVLILNESEIRNRESRLIIHENLLRILIDLFHRIEFIKLLLFLPPNSFRFSTVFYYYYKNFVCRNAAESFEQNNTENLEEQFYLPKISDFNNPH